MSRVGVFLRWALNELQEQFERLFANFVCGLSNRGQRRVEVAIPEVVVKSKDAQLFWNSDVLFINRLEYSEQELVVACQNCGRRMG